MKGGGKKTKLALFSNTNITSTNQALEYFSLQGVGSLNNIKNNQISKEDSHKMSDNFLKSQVIKDKEKELMELLLICLFDEKIEIDHGSENKDNLNINSSSLLSISSSNSQSKDVKDLKDLKDIKDIKNINEEEVKELETKNINTDNINTINISNNDDTIITPNPLNTSKDVIKNNEENKNITYIKSKPIKLKSEKLKYLKLILSFLEKNDINMMNTELVLKRLFTFFEKFFFRTPKFIRKNL